MRKILKVVAVSVLALGMTCSLGFAAQKANELSVLCPVNMTAKDAFATGKWKKGAWLTNNPNPTLTTQNSKNCQNNNCLSTLSDGQQNCWYKLKPGGYVNLVYKGD